jgi:hypothetical protein
MMIAQSGPPQLLASRPAAKTRVTAITTLRRTPAPNDTTEESDIAAG